MWIRGKKSKHFFKALGHLYFYIGRKKKKAKKTYARASDH